MGVNLAIHALDATTCERALAIIRAEDHDTGDAFVEEIDELPWWGAERGDYRSWDVIHWALTGRQSASDEDDGPMRLFGIPELESHVFGEWAALIDPPTTRRLADALARVDADTRRSRLGRVPDGVYWGEVFGQPDEHEDVLADAEELVAFVTEAAQGDRGLLLLLG